MAVRGSCSGGHYGGLGPWACCPKLFFTKPSQPIHTSPPVPPSPQQEHTPTPFVVLSGNGVDASPAGRAMPPPPARPPKKAKIVQGAAPHLAGAGAGAGGKQASLGSGTGGGLTPLSGDR